LPAYTDPKVYAGRRVFQRLGQMLETISLTFEVPVWLLDEKGIVVHKYLPADTPCLFIHGYEKGLLECNQFHRDCLEELSAFREPVVKNCYLGLGKILCPIRIENVLVGAIGVYPFCLSEYSPDEETRLDTIATTLGVERSPGFDEALKRVRVMQPLEMQKLVRFLSALAEESASSSYELADTVSQLVATYDELTLLYRMSQLVGMETATDSICDHVLGEVEQMLSPRHAFIMLVDESRHRLVMHKVLGENPQPFRHLHLDLGEGVLGQAVLTGEGFILNQLENDPVQQHLAQETVRSVAAAPMRVQDRAVGILVAADPRDGRPFVANDLKFLQALAGPTAISLEHARLSEERIRVERELAWSSIAFAAAHKLGNALFGLEGYLRRLPEILRDTPEDTDSLCQTLEMALHTMNNMKRTIQEFKDFARAEELRRSPVDLNKLLHRLVSPLQQEGSRWSVTENYQWDLSTLSLDEGRMEQVIGELIENAINAMPDGGSLRVATFWAQPDVLIPAGLPVDTKAVCVQVADNGPGIPAENKERIFESFFTTRGTGTGLGLAIVRKYVELHGGRIFENGTPGSGAVFNIVLPLFPPGNKRREG